MSYTVLSSTDLSAPRAAWTTVTTGAFDAEGEFSFTQMIDPAEPQQFYILQVP